MLKEFRGHSSFVNAAVYGSDGAQVGAASRGHKHKLRQWGRPEGGRHGGTGAGPSVPHPAAGARGPRVHPPLPPRRSTAPQVISAGADATVRVWDAKTCDCTFVFRPPQATAAAEAPVVGVALNPQVGGVGGACGGSIKGDQATTEIMRY